MAEQIRRWDPEQYPLVLIDAVVTVVMLKSQYSRLNLPIWLATIETELALVISGDSFGGSGGYVLAKCGELKCSSDETKRLLRELVADWDTIMPEEYKQHICSAVRQKEFFLTAIAVLDTLETPSSSRTVH